MEERPPDPNEPYRPYDVPPPAPPPPTPPPPLEWSPADESGAPPPLSSGLEPIPWEQPGLGFFAGFYETLRLLATSPRRAYERVAVTRAVGRPLGFALLVGWPGILATTLWDIAFRSQVDEWMPWMRNQNFDRSPVMEICFALATPLWFPVFLFLVAGLQHVFLWMVGGARSGYVQTFRVLCYAQVSALAGLIPLCGSLLTAIWHLVLQLIGLSAVHRIGVGRALLAMLLPLLLCCGCIAILFSMFGAAWFAAMKGGG
jgi:hypothetical protein